MANKQLRQICGLLPYACGLMSSWAFVLWASVLGAFVLHSWTFTLLCCTETFKSFTKRVDMSVYVKF